MTVGIYKITSPSGKIYIGQSFNIERRMSVYRRLQTESQPIIHHSLLKHGFDSHEIKIIHELPKDVTAEVMNEYETLYMSLYRDCGVEMMNACHGGRNKRRSLEARKGMCGRKHTEETKMKISKGNKGQKRSLETKKLIAKLRTGKPTGRSPMKGKVGYWKGKKLLPSVVEGMRKPKTDEQKAKLSNARMGVEPWNKGKKNTQVPWNKGKKGAQVAWNKGIKMSDETRKKVSESKKGTPAWNKGLKIRSINN